MVFQKLARRTVCPKYDSLSLGCPIVPKIEPQLLSINVHPGSTHLLWILWFRSSFEFLWLCPALRGVSSFLIPQPAPQSHFPWPLSQHGLQSLFVPCTAPPIPASVFPSVTVPSWTSSLSFLSSSNPTNVCRRSKRATWLHSWPRLAHFPLINLCVLWPLTAPGAAIHDLVLDDLPTYGANCFSTRICLRLDCGGFKVTSLLVPEGGAWSAWTLKHILLQD